MRLLLLIIHILAVWPVLADSEANLECVTNSATALTSTYKIQSAIKEYNAAPADALEIDARWAELDDQAPEIQRVLTNQAAAALTAYLHHFSIRGESFLIGRNGGLVAATNRTSDFYQADEAQFSETIRLKPGEHWARHKVQDESAGATLTKIAVPVYPAGDEDSDSALGVLVVGIDALILDSEQVCGGRPRP